MGTRRNPGFGMVILDDRIASTALVARGGGAQESAYTEASPQPGHPEPADATSRWRPHAVHAQSVEITSRTLRGGYPGRDGASIAYRLGTDTDNADYRGWSEPNLLVNFTSPTDGWGASADWESVTCAVNPKTGIIVVTAVTSANAGMSWSYNPRTEAWTDGFEWPDGLLAPIGMAWDPVRERFLLWSGRGGETDDYGFYSTDNGATWTAYTRFAFENDQAQNSATGVTRFAVQPDKDWLCVWVISPNGATGTSTQFASSDHGATWEHIHSGIANDAQNTLFPLATKDGNYVIVGLNAAGRPCCWRMPSARTPVEDVSPVFMNSDSAVDHDNIWGVVDDDGIVYVWAAGERTPSTVAGSQFITYRSLDHGASWEVYHFEYMCFDTVTAVAPAWHAAVASCGQCHLVGTFTATSPEADVDGTIHLASFGGWGQLEAGYGPLGNARRRDGRFGFGEYDTDATVAFGKCWVGYDYPDNIGWTLDAGSTGTLQPTGETACIELTAAAAGASEMYSPVSPQAAASDAVCLAAQWVVKAASDQGNLSTIPAGGRGINVRLTLSNGTTSWRGTVVVGKDGIRVENAAGTSLGTAAVTMTEWTTIRVGIFAARISVWYRQRGGGTAWTQVVPEATLTAGVLATCDVEWGLLPGVAGTEAAHGFYRMVGFTTRADWRVGLEANDIDQDADEEVLGLIFGKTLPGAGASYPIPDATTTAQDLGYIRASGGPTYFGEVVALPEGYQYPIEAIHPDESPSPRVQWRATAETAVNIVWDLGRISWHGGGIGLVVLNAVPRTFDLAIDDGAGGWTALDTLDKGWGSINYTLSGRTVVPRSGTATIARYIHEGELVGGYMVCSTAGADVARRIARNSGGYWTTDTTLQRVHIELDDVDGTESTSGAGQIVHHSGLICVFPTTDPVRRLLRVQIDASQVTPEGRYEAGIIGIGRIVAAGADPGWDWSRMTELSRETARRADGALEVRRTGPPRRVLRYAWPDGVHLLSSRLLASNPDYFAVGASGLPLATAEDASTSFVGVLVEQLRSGEVPAVMVPKLPTGTGSGENIITDPTLYLYGRLLSDTWDVSGVTGEEGTNEVVRVGGGLTFEELS